MEPPSALAAQKARKTEKLRPLPAEKIFEISRFLSQSLTDPRSSETLHRRMRNYAYTKRRGRLRLPQYLPAKIRGLSNLTKRQVREILYWVKPGTGLKHPLSKAEYQFASQLIVVPIWNRLSEADSHTAHSVGLARLSRSDAPSVGRALWPSAPSFTEMLEMSRRGVPLPTRCKYGPRYTVENCITRQDLSNYIRLARKIVAKYIVGIRSSVEIPEQFVPWFRYRHGFSILSTRFTLPSGLVRFLLAQWKIRHTNLWLVEHCPLRIFLRRHTAVEVAGEHFDTVVRPESHVSWLSDHSGMGSPSTEPFPRKTEDEVVAELGEKLSPGCGPRTTHPSRRHPRDSNLAGFPG
jgi:hypothetical protein